MAGGPCLRMLRRPHPAVLPMVIASVLLGACATTTSQSGRTQFVVPKQVGAAYSEIELQAMLTLAPDSACAAKTIDKACEAAVSFRRQVQQIGSRLGRAARDLRGELGRPVPYFQVLVPAKEEQGTLSSAGGTVVVFDGLRALDFQEPALAFVVAREMGHVLAEHHEENSATSLMMSAAITLALPMANLLRGAAAVSTTAATATASTSVAATAATTAASVAGTRVLKSLYRPDQLREADMLALRLMVRAGWTPMEVADALQAAAPRLKEEGWMEELLVSKQRLDQITMGPPWLLPSTVADARAATVID